MPNSNKPRPRKTDQVDILAAGVVFLLQTLRQLFEVLEIKDEKLFAEMDQIGVAVVDKCARLYLPVEEIESLGLGKHKAIGPVSPDGATVSSVG